MHQWCYIKKKNMEDNMARRSVTLTPNLEKLIRTFQARTIEASNQDVSFTETLNAVLAFGIASADFTKMTKEQLELAKSLLEGADLAAEGTMDKLYDNVVARLMKSSSVTS